MITQRRLRRAQPRLQRENNAIAHRSILLSLKSGPATLNQWEIYGALKILAHAWNEADESSKTEQLEVIRKLLERLENLNVKNAGNHTTPLHEAAKFRGSNTALVQLFLDHHANVHAVDEHGHTPLHLVKNIKIAQLLLDNGANIHARNHYSKTPSEEALLLNLEDIATLLKQKEAEIPQRQPVIQTQPSHPCTISLFRAADASIETGASAAV